MFYCLVTVSASGGKTLIPRLNLCHPPPAAPYGLASYGICGQFPHLLTQTRKLTTNTIGQRELTDALRLLPTATAITRPEDTTGAIHINDDTEVLTGLPSRYL